MKVPEGSDDAGSISSLAAVGDDRLDRLLFRVPGLKPITPYNKPELLIIEVMVESCPEEKYVKRVVL